MQSIELWSSDLFDRDAEPHHEGSYDSATEGLLALWRAVLTQGVQDGGGATFTDFTLRGLGRVVSLPRDPFENPELALLRARRHEPHFFPRVAALHERTLGEPFSFGPYLALPVELPAAVTKVLEVLGAALSLRGAVDSSWRLGDAANAHLQVSATGAEWAIDVRGVGVRFRVHLDGTTWAPRVETDGSAGAQTLEDALTAARGR